MADRSLSKGSDGVVAAGSSCAVWIEESQRVKTPREKARKINILEILLSCTIST
jgi:hypothetical protein